MKKYYIPQGSQMWLYVRNGKYSDGKFTGRERFTHHDLPAQHSTKSVVYTERDFRKLLDESGNESDPHLMYFELPPTNSDFVYVAFRSIDVEVVDDAV